MRSGWPPLAGAALLSVLVGMLISGNVSAAPTTTISPISTTPSPTITTALPNNENVTGNLNVTRVVPILARTRQDIRADFMAAEFVFDLLNSEPISGPGGSIRPMSVDEVPSLAGEGVAYTLFTIEPCGINLPHLHPRATEFIYLIRGDMVRTAFVGENGEGAAVNDLSAGMATFFPQDLIHFQQNFGCEPAVFLSALNSEDPGVVTILSQLFMVADEHLSSTFDQGMERIRELREGLPMGPAEGQQECLQRCNLLQDGAIAPNALGATGAMISPTHLVTMTMALMGVLFIVFV